MHSDKVCPAAETYIGLVELGVGLIPGGGTSEELGRFLQAEMKKWGALIKEVGIASH